MSESRCKSCQDRARKGEGPCPRHSLKARAERATQHTQDVRQWRYEGGEPPTVEQMRDEIAMEEALTAWYDEHVIKTFLARRGIGEGLKYALPERRRERGILALSLQAKPLTKK